MTLREQATSRLRQSVNIDTDYCLVGETRLKRSERDLLLKQLENGESYLKVPMALFFSSLFWRELKVESNNLVEREGHDR